MPSDLSIPREVITAAYVRVCRDSGFTMAATDVAHFVGNMLGISAWAVWQAVGDLSTMERVACGEHPVCHVSTKTP
jgi:hypothetical protein